MSLVDALVTQPAGTCAHGPIRTAWESTTGRPDVVIDVLDSGIEWNNQSAMTPRPRALASTCGSDRAPSATWRSAPSTAPGTLACRWS